MVEMLKISGQLNISADLLLTICRELQVMPKQILLD